jgi:hypothetical protein
MASRSATMVGVFVARYFVPHIGHVRREKLSASTVVNSLNHDPWVNKAYLALSWLIVKQTFQKSDPTLAVQRLYRGVTVCMDASTYILTAHEGTKDFILVLCGCKKEWSTVVNSFDHDMTAHTIWLQYRWRMCSDIIYISNMDVGSGLL